MGNEDEFTSKAFVPLAKVPMGDEGTIEYFVMLGNEHDGAGHLIGFHTVEEGLEVMKHTMTQSQPNFEVTITELDTTKLPEGLHAFEVGSKRHSFGGLQLPEEFGKTLWDNGTVVEYEKRDNSFLDFLRGVLGDDGDVVAGDDFMGGLEDLLN